MEEDLQDDGFEAKLEGAEILFLSAIASALEQIESDMPDDMWQSWIGQSVTKMLEIAKIAKAHGLVDAELGADFLSDIEDAFGDTEAVDSVIRDSL